MAYVAIRGLQDTSEFVTNGHPDRLCDLIASILINDIQHKDGYNSHAAVEVFLTHDTCIFGGEVKTTLAITEDYLKQIVHQAYQRAGYLDEMREFWNKDEVCLAGDLKIINKIEAQSPDIARATTDKAEVSGWNDQNISFSSSEDTNIEHLGIPHLIARDIGDYLHSISRDTILNDVTGTRYGPDIKVVVTCDVADNGFTPIDIAAITIAIPHTREASHEEVFRDIKDYVTVFLNESQNRFNCPLRDDCVWTINGTGRFVVHGNISDCSMTGRKISVNHPSAGPVWCNKMIGGGSMIKPSHASDLLLPLAARYLANVLVASGLTTYAVVGLSCAIGQQKIQSVFVHGDESFETDPDFARKVSLILVSILDLNPHSLIEKFELHKIDFSKVVETNFFGEGWMPWENPALIEEGTVRLQSQLNS